MFGYSYDADSRLTSRVTPARGTTSYGYDAVGNLTAVTYPTSPSISLTYDALNRLTSLTDGLGTSTFTYNSVGQLLSEGGLWSGDTVNYTYNNRLRSGLSVGSWAQNYGYDAIKRLTSVTSPAGTFNYNYDAAQMTRVDALTLPGGGYITNAFDALARLTDTRYVTPDGGIINGHGYALNNGNQRTQQTRFGGSTTNTVDYGYDPLGQLTSAKGREAGGTSRLQEQFGYAYDAAGNLQYRTNNALVQNFSVNALNQLTTVTRSGTLTVAGNTSKAATNVTVNGFMAYLYGDYSFAKDGFSLVNGTNTFVAVAMDAFGHNDTNTSSVYLPVTNSFVYDGNGNMTYDGQHSLTYDDENQLILITVTNQLKKEFTYDGMRRLRVRKDYVWSGGSWTQANELHFVYDGLVILQIRDSGNNPKQTFTRGLDLSGSFQGAGGTGGLLAMTDQTQTNALLQTAFYHSDGNGNVTALVSSNGLILASAQYDPYGRPTAMSGPLAGVNPFWFSSQLYDADTGFVHYLYRVYAPSLQRWLNRDPIGEEGGVALYIFLNNRPIDHVDAFGLQVFTPPYGLWPPTGSLGEKPASPPKPINGLTFDPSAWKTENCYAYALNRHGKPLWPDGAGDHIPENCGELMKMITKEAKAIDKEYDFKTPCPPGYHKIKV